VRANSPLLISATCVLLGPSGAARPVQVRACPKGEVKAKFIISNGPRFHPTPHASAHPWQRPAVIAAA
jgi:hypothetical protein